MKAQVACALPGRSFAVCVFATAATGSGSHAKSGGTFRLGTSSRIDSLNPFVAFNQDAYSTFEYIYPVLIQYDSEPQLRARLRDARGRPRTAARRGRSRRSRRHVVATASPSPPPTPPGRSTPRSSTSGGAANAAGLIAHITHADAPTPTTLVVHYAAGRKRARPVPAVPDPAEAHLVAAHRPQGQRPEVVREQRAGRRRRARST